MKRAAIALAAALLLSSCGKGVKSGFAIVVDPVSYNEAKAEIDGYQKTVENRGLYPILVVDRWGVPDSIRAELVRLYNAQDYPIEGCVLIGDIPIARTREAQHMTTAFKMDQDGSFPRTDYTVATDRYYDSFDLEWEFLEQDSVRPEYFYYRLKADCAQKLNPTIYSARIMPRSNSLGDKHDKLRRYLQRVNQADSNNNPLDRMFYFSGYGYVSESVDTRIDEKAEYLDQFPWMKGQRAAISYLDWKRDQFVKERLCTEMQNGEYDWAILHHHGSPEIEHLSDLPVGNDYDEAVYYLKQYILEQTKKGLAKGRTLIQCKEAINKAFGCTIPDEWFQGEPDYDAQKERNLYCSDFESYHPQARMVTLDGCYNGSFHKDESIQEAYLFGQDNGTVAVMGNSVNVLQNKWVMHFMGMTGLGMRVGNLAKYGAFLEAHVFGDPTFAFTPAEDCGFNVNDALINGSTRFWKKQLDNTYPAVQVMAMDKLAMSDENCSDLIFSKFRTSASGLVRTAALEELKRYRDDNYVNALILGLNDAHEMCRRLAVVQAGRCGDDRLVEPLVRLYCENVLPERVGYEISASLRILDSTKVMSAFDKVFPEFTMYSGNRKVYEEKRQNIHRICTAMVQDVEETVFDTSLDLYDRKMALRTTRNNNCHELVPRELEYLKNPSDVELQTIMWEALGWYQYSYRAPEIAALAKNVANDVRFDRTIREEALKTYNRIK